MRTRSFLLSVVIATAALLTSARADVTIIGALSNFDCPNETGQVTDEFVIEFEGPHASDCYGTYSNWNYGPGRIVDNAAGTGIVVTYSRVGHTTQPHAIEHFGVHMANFSLITARSFTWKANGAVITTGAGSLPIPIPVTRVVPATPISPPVIVEAVENESPEEVIWVRRSILSVAREVALDELMWDSPLVQGATPLSVELEKLEPGETIENEEPEPEDNTMAFVIVVETYEDVATWNAALQDYDHAPGELRSRAMNATIVQRQCADIPVIDLEPIDAHSPLDGGVDFYAHAVGPAAGGQLLYQWHHDGVDMEGEDTDHLNIDPITLATAGMYTCTMTNDCGSVSTRGAQLFVDIRPTVVTQPVAFEACSGGNAVFTAVVDGSTPFAFQWQRGSTPLDMANPRYSVLNGSFCSTLTISNVGPADVATGNGGYRVLVSNVAGNRTSGRAPLTIGAGQAPGILAQPAPVSTCPGGTATFTIAISGAGPFTYVWRRDGTPIDPGTDPRYSVSVSPDGLIGTLTLSGADIADAGSFDCRISSPCGTTPTTAATLTVCPADWNCTDGVDSQDYFDFLEAFFNGDADFNGYDGTDSQDYFDFLEAFFTGC